MSDGTYVHLGVKKILMLILTKYSAHLYLLHNVLKVGHNIDGLHFSKSSMFQYWPILVATLIINKLPINVVIINIFYGFKKSKCIEEFLNQFI